MIPQSKMTDVYTEFSGLDELRARAGKHDPQALREAAGQFEALFLQMTLKSMREAVSKSSLFKSSEQELYTGLFDQQLALQLGGINNLGIADMVFRQLGGEEQVQEGGRFEDYLLNARPAAPAVTTGGENVWTSAESFLEPAVAAGRPEPWSNAESFIRHLMPTAARAAHKLNIAPEAILAVTALETGWGSHVIQRNEGGSSFNLFGIKATPDWNGDSVVASTLEFGNGVLQKRQEMFRSYRSPEDSVADFAGLIENNPRYKDAMNTGNDTDSFFAALQNGGYATDPDYAKKLNEVVRSEPMQRVFKK